VLTNKNEGVAVTQTNGLAYFPYFEKIKIGL
jgi:hypothetical protein